MSRLCLAASIGAALVVTSPAYAQNNPPAGPAYVVSYIEVAPSARPAARKLLHQIEAASRKENGNVGFEVLERVDRPQHFLILEAWKDAKAQSDHAGGSAAKTFRDNLKPLLTAPYDERPSFSFLAAVPAKRDARSLYAVTHVDFVGAKKDDGLAALKQLASEAAKEPGVQRFDIWQQNNRPNHITLVEAWRGKPALEVHEQSAASRKFRDDLMPIGGALYDQRLYRAIN